MKTWHVRAVFGAILMLALGGVAVAQVATPPPNLGCTDRTIKGDWGFRVSGEAWFNGLGAPPIIRDGVAMTHFDGQGNLSQEDFVMANGSPQGPPNTFHGGENGKYQINSDCTGIGEITFPNGMVVKLLLVVSNFGQTIHTIVSEIDTPPDADGNTSIVPASIHSDAERLSFF